MTASTQESAHPTTPSPAPENTPAPTTGDQRTVVVTKTTSPRDDAISGTVTTVIGLALGIANQYLGMRPDGTLGSMGLRIPALIAALLMVGHGVLLIGRARSGSSTKTAKAVGNAGTVASIMSQLKAQRPAPRGTAHRTPEAVVIEKPAAENKTAAYALVGLGFWLGWANLNFHPDALLTALALVAAISLFAMGYGQLADPDA